MSSRLISRQSDAPSSSAKSTERHSLTDMSEAANESKVISSRSVSYGCASDFQASGPVHSPSLSRFECDAGAVPPAAVPQPHHSQIRKPVPLRLSEIAIRLPRSPALV